MVFRTTDPCPPLFQSRAFALGPTPIPLSPAPPQSGAVTRSGAPKCSICVQSPFPPAVHLHFFNHDLILLLPAVSLTPSHPTVFLFSQVLRAFSDFRFSEFHTSTGSHLFGCLLCTWHPQQQPAPPGMGTLGH